jgi:hypothetical protein
LRAEAPDAFLSFLPPPDNSKRAKKIWLLPNFSAFTNIYARINKYHRQHINGVTLVHDQQLQLDEILKDAKRSTETVGSIEFTPYSDYSFTESAVLEFSGSNECIGIQCADLLAGTVMRYFRDTHNGGFIPKDIGPVMNKLLSGSDAMHGFGINQVVPERMVLPRAMASVS